MFIYGLVLFGFMDELFFKLGLYQADHQNVSVLTTNENPFKDVHIYEKDEKSEKFRVSINSGTAFGIHS